MSGAFASAFGGVGKGRHVNEPGPFLAAVSRPYRERSLAMDAGPGAGPSERIVQVGDRSRRAG